MAAAGWVDPASAEKSASAPTPAGAAEPKREPPAAPPSRATDAAESAKTPEKALSPADDMASPDYESLLPPSANATYVSPGYVRPNPKDAPGDAATGSKNSLIIIAGVAGTALGSASVLAVYLLMRPDTAPGASPRASSPFAHAASSATAAAVAVSSPSVPIPLAASPAPVDAPDPERPAASFAQTPKLVVNGLPSPPKPRPKPVPKPVDEDAAQKRSRPKGPNWTFQGMAFDLLTTRGVFAAKLVFLDANGDVVGTTETGPGGRYKITIPAGTGYKLKISHGDYADRYIDEGDTTSSLRDATPEERKILMSASARNVPWVGDPKKPTTRDLALVPRGPEEP